MDRIRFNGKTLVNDDPLSTKYETFRQILDTNVLYLQVNVVQKDLQSVFSDIHSLQFQISQSYVESINQFTIELNFLEITLVQVIHDGTDGKNPIIFLILT